MKLITVILALCLTFSLTACESEADKKEQERKEQAEKRKEDLFKDPW